MMNLPDIKTKSKPDLEVVLAEPRGFCAGVVRAIQIVEKALERWGPPVYVRHEIVHNQHVVNSLMAKGAIFVEELEECPDDRPVIFSAHGVPKSVIAEAKGREMLFVDATCPLVSKVHSESNWHIRSNRQIVMIGHRDHPETIGTIGQVPEGEIFLIEEKEEVDRIKPRDAKKLAYVTQTTLSHDDTIEIVERLKEKFPDIVGPKTDDICYATTNRQEAVKAMIPLVEALIVVGAPNSSNSKRLVETGWNAGCTSAQLVQGAGDIDWKKLESVSRIGLTAGASSPEVLVMEVLDALRERFNVSLQTVTTAKETTVFSLPRNLGDDLPRPGHIN